MNLHNVYDGVLSIVFVICLLLLIMSIRIAVELADIRALQCISL